MAVTSQQNEAIMSVSFPSEDWAKAYHEAINANAAYQSAAADWTHGDVALVIQTGGRGGLAEHVGAVLDVHEGSCRHTRYVESLSEAQQAKFVIVADYATWQRVIEGQLDPIDGMLSGELDLTQGSLPTMIRYVDGSKELVASARTIPTAFLD